MNLVNDEHRGYFERARELLSPKVQGELLRYAGNRVMAAALESIPDYPRQRGAPMPMGYTRTSKAKKPYRPIKGGPVRRPGESFQSKYKDEKHRAGYFGRLARGEISVPYRRSGGLEQSWTGRVRLNPGLVLEVRIGTNKDYARLVVGRKRQAPYHQDWWWVFEDEMQGNLAYLQDTFGSAFKLALFRKMKGYT